MSTCAEKLKILSSPQRLKILEILSKERLNVSELNERLDLPQNLLSYHLKVLEEYDFIVGHREGKNIIYKNTRNLSAKDDKLTIDLQCCEINF